MVMGRPRTFCSDTALDRALEVFWRKGYDGTSLSDLTEAMGINRPSLYAAFGNKEELFRKALNRYATEKATYMRTALEAPTMRGVTERLLFGAVDMLTDPYHPVGCLVVRGALTCGTNADGVREALDRIRAEHDEHLNRRFQRAKDEGDLPAEADPATLARYISTVIQGMSLQAAAGTDRDALRRVADMALRALPLPAS